MIIDFIKALQSCICLKAAVRSTCSNCRALRNLGTYLCLYLKGAGRLGRTIADAWKEICYKPADINSNCDWQ